MLGVLGRRARHSPSTLPSSKDMPALRGGGVSFFFTGFLLLSVCSGE